MFHQLDTESVALLCLHNNDNDSCHWQSPFAPHETLWCSQAELTIVCLSVLHSMQLAAGSLIPIPYSQGHQHILCSKSHHKTLVGFLDF